MKSRNNSLDMRNISASLFSEFNNASDSHLGVILKDESDDDDLPSTPALTKNEVIAVSRKAQEHFRALQSNQSTAVIAHMLGASGEPIVEVEYDETKSKPKLIAAIAAAYEKKIREVQNTATREQDSQYEIPFGGSRPSITEFIDNLDLRMDKISATAFLHMTMMIDTWLAANSSKGFNENNCYGLVATSLCIAHHFHDGWLYNMNEFAWGSEVSVYTFEPWQKVFLKEIQNQTFYSVKDYQEAQERFLSSAEQNPVFTNLAEFKHEVVGRAGEPLTAHLKYNRVREIDEEKPIVKTILERLSVHLEKAIAESKKHLLMRSPFDVDKLSEEESVRTYLTNIPKKLHNNSSIYIYMFAILDTWLKKTGCRLNEYNYKRLIATSFSLAQDYCNDDAYAYPDQVVAGAFQVKWEVLCNLRKKLLVEIEDEFHFQPELYEKYHAILLPEYNIDLTRRPEPVSSEEKIPAPNPSATETPSPVVDETAPRVTFHF